MRCLFIFVAFALAAPASWAQFSGVVSGRVTATDSREDPYSAAGYLSSTNPLGNAEFRLPNRFNDRLVNVPEILVEVCVELGFVPCRYQWTRTDEGGRFAVPWSGLLPPTKIRARVYAMRPQLADGEVIAGSNPPPREFRVTTAGVTNAIVGSNEINSSTGGLEGNQTPECSLVDHVDGCRSGERIPHSRGNLRDALGTVDSSRWVYSKRYARGRHLRQQRFLG